MTRDRSAGQGPTESAGFPLLARFLLQEFAVVKDGIFNEPLLLVVAPGSTSTGGTQVQPLNVPVLRPAEVKSKLAFHLAQTLTTRAYS